MTCEPIAHFREYDHSEQLLIDHLTGTAHFTGQFASKIGLQKTGELLGLLHDVGKSSQSFQNYIRSAVGLIPRDHENFVDVTKLKGKIDHSTAGAQLLHFLLDENPADQGHISSQILTLCLSSHHSGLIDCIDPAGKDKYAQRMQKKYSSTYLPEAQEYWGKLYQKSKTLDMTEIVSQIINQIKSIKGKSKNVLWFKYGLLTRFLLSCLLDGDRLDTADFENIENLNIRHYGKYPTWNALIQQLDKKLAAFKNGTVITPINSIRESISNACYEASDQPQGIFKLAVPTGGGKTLASLRFALHHAKKNHLDRIFFIIPYTSIIDQNANTVRDILENDDLKDIVLEHHSNLTPEEETKTQSLLSENWDAPVVFTTQVQFFEALFGSGTRGARRMHQLANSVIIFDEIQTLPVKTIYMFNTALQFLVETCHATAVLCTATQPLLDKVQNSHKAIKIDHQIIENENQLNNQLKRVNLYNQCTFDGWNDEQISQLVLFQLEEKNSALIITNTKGSAKSLFTSIKEVSDIENIYHLSTNMCPTHRLTVINEIKEALEKKEQVVCVSTQLIEAGVDIDFGCVIRYKAGLDSIIQAAGRCNRHNLHESKGNVFIVNPKKENVSSLEDIKVGIEVTDRILREFQDRPPSGLLDLDVIKRYYDYYFYQRCNQMDYPLSAASIGHTDTLYQLLSTNILSYQEFTHSYQNHPYTYLLRQSFQTAGKKFHVINTNTRSVIVHYKESATLIHELCSANGFRKQYSLVKQARRYCVNLYHPLFDRLLKAGAIHETQNGMGIYYLDNSFYDKDFGITEQEIASVTNYIL